MTKTMQRGRDSLKRGGTGCVFSAVILLLSIYVSIFWSSEVAHAVKSSLTLCANVIIPSVFPFIILSDIMLASVDFSSLGPIPRIFERVFGIRKEGVSAFLLGIICGFPLGVKCAADLYRSGAIEKEEAERLIGFSNNTGPAFIVSGIGLALHGNTGYGILLYAVMLVSAVLVGIIFKRRAPRQEYFCKATPVRRKFKAVESVRSAATGTLNVCAFITIFAPLCNFLRHILTESRLYLCIIPFLEVGSATSILSKTALLTKAQSLSLSAFAICFSGFSVHMQALSFLEDTDLNAIKYFIMKLMQGSIAAAITFIAATIFPF